MSRYWTCRRQQDGIPCRALNQSRKRNCTRCGKPKPARRKPAHMKALELDYADYVDLNGGEHCGLCGALPSAKRKLDRDHDHRTGKPRGLLCVRCNRSLPNWVTTTWLRDAITYLERVS